MTSAWNIGGPTAHSVSLSLSPYRVGGFSSLYTDAALCARARAYVCGTSLGAAARHAPGDVGVRERLPPVLLQSIPTDAFVPVAFVPGRFARSARRTDSRPYFADISCNN